MLPSTKKIILFSGAMLVLAVGVYAGMWYIVSLREDAMHTSLALQAEEKARRQNALALTLVFEDTKEDRAKLQEYVVSADGVTSFLELVERMGREQGLSVDTKSVTLEPVAGSDVFETLVVVLSSEGSYENTKAMLALVETIPFQIRVQSVSLGREGGGESWTNTLTMQVTKEK